MDLTCRGKCIIKTRDKGEGREREGEEERTQQPERSATPSNHGTDCSAGSRPEDRKFSSRCEKEAGRTCVLALAQRNLLTIGRDSQDSDPSIYDEIQFQRP